MTKKGEGIFDGNWRVRCFFVFFCVCFTLSNVMIDDAF